MAQNATVTLTASQADTAARYFALLSPLVGRNLTVVFFTREGEQRTVYGEVAAVLAGATPDKGCVRVLTEEGYKSANLWRIVSVTNHGEEEAREEARREEAHKRATVGW